MNLGKNLKKISALFLGIFIAVGCYAQTYTTLPFTDDFSTGSIGSSMTWSQTGTVGAALVTDASGGWPQFGTCTTCANVGNSAGNGLMLYNTANPSGGNNQINLDVHLDLSASSSVEFQFALVDFGSGTYDTIAVWLSDDGGSNFSYSTNIPLNQAPHADGTWNEMTYDLSTMLSASGLSLTNQVVFRMAAMIQRKGTPASPKQTWNDQAIYFDNFKATTLVALPVELISFTGMKTANGNLLNWTTATEIDNSHFDVQVSDDGVVWRTIGTVQGNGTSMDEHNYGYLDQHASGSVHYYRLKQVDFDGSYAYSEVITIQSENVDFEFEVLENGTNPNVSFGALEGSVSVKLYSVSGQLVADQLVAQSNTFVASNYAVSSGMYMLVASYKGEVKSKRISIVK